MNLKTYTKSGNVSKRPVAVNEDIFGARVNQVLLAQGVRVYLSNQRQGTSQVQTRSEVNRTKSKWYQQKGTGNARHGSKNAPIFVGGGVAHGPTGQENWKKKMPRQLKQKALISALSAQSEQMVVTDSLLDLKGKTKEAASLLEKMVQQDEKVLIIFAEFKESVTRAMRNLPRVKMTRAKRLNIYELALADRVILTKEAVEVLENKLAGVANAN